jgi:hypothetical protein
MADEQKAGFVDHLINVQCDIASSTLTLAQPATGLKPGDRVVWQFFGMPEGWSPWIVFRPQEDGTHFLGPFADLTQSGAALWGVCRMDPVLTGREFIYRVSIQKGMGAGWDKGEAVISSRAGSLTVGSEEAGSVQRFTVTPSADVPLSLTVSPIGVIIQPGDTVEWDFEQIPDEPNTWRPVVSFSHYDGKGEVPNDYLGPFTSLTTGTDRVRGTGNTRVSGTYYFQVSVVRVSDGEILRVGSSDPAIDNRGGVADPTGGGDGG